MATGSGTGTLVSPGGSPTTVEPIFLTRAELLAAIRLSTAADAQTVALIDSAIQDVRAELYTNLGIVRVTEILTYSVNENPTVANELIRLQARLCETQWNTLKLVKLLPVSFLENEHTVHETFNEEPLTRDSTALAEFCGRLEKSVQRLLNLIRSIPTGDGSFMSSVIGKQDSDGDVDVYSVNKNFIGLFWGTLDAENTNV